MTASEGHLEPDDLTTGDRAGQAQGSDSAAGAGSSAAGAPAGEPRKPPHIYVEGGPGASSEPGGDDEYDHSPADTSDRTATSGTGSAADPAADAVAGEGEALAQEESMAATLLADLQRVQAEYVNYKKRVDRDRDVIRTTAVGGVVESLLPVLDDIHMARAAGDLADGPFASIADKLETILGRFGVERIGGEGEEFDPTVHEALMHVEAELPEGASGTTVVQVLQPGYRIGERLVRAARVSVADPG